jgi:nucleotide-binding universal stress UspA family protein
MMKKILIPTDFKKESFQTTKYGMNLALKLNMEVLLLHVLNLGQIGSTASTEADFRAVPQDNVEHTEQHLKAAKMAMKKTIETLTKEFDSLPVIESKIETGPLKDTIAGFTKQEETALLLLTAKEDGGFLQFMTYINNYLTEKSGCPVLIVPESAEFHDFNRIVYATDYKQEDIQAFKTLSAYAKPFDGFIYGLHMTQDNFMDERMKKEGFRENVRKQVGYENLNVYLVKGDDIIKNLEDFAEESEADVIALHQENENFFKKVFSENTARKVARKSHLPVLVFHND